MSKTKRIKALKEFIELEKKLNKKIQYKNILTGLKRKQLNLKKKNT